MKIYVLIPLSHSTLVKIKERNYRIMRSSLARDYSRHFGVKNEYYVDLATRTKEYNISGGRNAQYNGGNWWYYSAFDPYNVIKKKEVK